MLQTRIPPKNVREEVMKSLNADELNFAAVTCLDSWIHTLKNIDFSQIETRIVDELEDGERKREKYLRFAQDQNAGHIAALERVLELLEESQKATPGGLSG